MATNAFRFGRPRAVFADPLVVLPAADWPGNDFLLASTANANAFGFPPDNTFFGGDASEVDDGALEWKQK